MSNAKSENMPKVGKPHKVPDASKKIAPEKDFKNKAQLKLDFSKWLDMYVSGVHVEKLNVSIPQLNSEFRNIASELVAATSGITEKPTPKFKIEKLPFDFIRVLRTKISNPFFLIVILCNSVTEIEVKKLIIGDLSKLKLNKEDIEYLLNKLGAIKDENMQQIIWNDFLLTGILAQENWKEYQFKFLDWGFSHGLLISNPIETIIGLRAASDQFKNLDTPTQNKTYRKLLELDILTFLAFLLHISSESFSAKFFEQIINKKNKVVLLTFLENRPSFAGPWLDNFEKLFIAPNLRTTLDGIMRFEDLLPFVVKQSYFVHLIPADTLSRAVARSFKRNDDYSMLFEDTRVEKLNGKVEDLAQDNVRISGELTIEKSRNQEQEKRIKEFESAIENYETQLRSKMTSENLGSDALSQNAKAELLRTLVESLDHLLQGNDGFQLERALQKMGISRLGEPGSDFAWDAAVCETLTGVAMENGIVVRSGYTWLNMEKKIVIQRVLLKTK